MCSSSKCLIVALFLTLFFGLAFLIAMICFWVFYRSEPAYAGSVTLISLPFTDTARKVPISRNWVTRESGKQTLSIAHNVASYDISLRVCEQTGNAVLSTTFSGSSSTNRVSLASEFPVASENGRIHVSCPAPPTNVTVELGLEPACEDSSGALAALDGGYVRTDLGTVSFDKMQGDIYVDLAKLTVTPADAIPQIYLAATSDTRKKAFFICAIVFTVAYAITLGFTIFMCWWMFLLGAAADCSS